AGAPQGARSRATDSEPDVEPLWAAKRKTRRSSLHAERRRGTAELQALLQPKSFDAVRVDRLVQRVDAVRECLQEAEQRGVRAHEARAVRAVVQALVGVP